MALHNGLFIAMLVCAAPVAMSLQIGTMDESMVQDPGSPDIAEDLTYEMPAPQVSLLQSQESAQQLLQQNRKRSLQRLSAATYVTIARMDELHQKYELDNTYYGQTMDDLKGEVNSKAMRPENDEMYDHRYSMGDRKAMPEGTWDSRETVPWAPGAE